MICSSRLSYHTMYLRVCMIYFDKRHVSFKTVLTARKQ